MLTKDKLMHWEAPQKPFGKRSQKQTKHINKKQQPKKPPKTAHSQQLRAAQPNTTSPEAIQPGNSTQKTK